MMKKEHKIGIIAIICVLLGMVIAFAYMYHNGNKIEVLQSDTNATYQKDNKKHSEKYSTYKADKEKGYNVFNYYYPKDSNQTQQEKDVKPFLSVTKTSDDNLILDLNNCDTLDLQMIRGIGPSYSRRIYKYGQKLGGYVSVQQLKEVYGMDNEKYNSIEKYFKCNPNNIRKLNVNTSTIKQLASHPYIDPYLAKEIIVFRQNYGPVTDVNQLKAIHLMDDSLFNKIQPYLTAE